MMRIGMLLLLLAAVLLGGGCRSQAPDKGKTRPVVITTLFPLYDFCRTIAGDRMDVQLLLPPGVEPHHFEPRPDDLLRIQQAALFVYIGPFMEPWADRVLTGVDRKRLRVVAAAEGIPLLPAPDHSGAEQHHRHGTHHAAVTADPHVWLDFALDQQMVARVRDALIAADPAGAEQYRLRAEQLLERLRQLDQAYTAGLANCQSRILLHGGHAAFGYLARRYNLTYLAAAGITAELETTPRRMTELVQQMRAHKVTAIFSEELVSPRVARTLAGETGATVYKLHGAHSVASEDLVNGVSFVQLMEENLKNLQAGLVCRN